MTREIKVALIGLDTSHSVVFPQRMQRNCPAGQRVSGLKPISCLRFKTAFQTKKGLDVQQQQLEKMGIKVTKSFDEAVEDCDAIMLEINDPSYHVEYFRKVAAMGKPVFLDKPLAGTVKDGRTILRLAKKNKTKVMSCSAFRFSRDMLAALRQVPAPRVVNAYGPGGKAPAGDALIWYGVHTFEMLERVMGRGAWRVTACENKTDMVAIVDYKDGRQGVVEVRAGFRTCGGRLQSTERVVPYLMEGKWWYVDLLREIKRFFETGKTPATLLDAFEILAMMEAARRSIETGKSVHVAKYK